MFFKPKKKDLFAVGYNCFRKVNFDSVKCVKEFQHANLLKGRLDISQARKRQFRTQLRASIGFVVDRLSNWVCVYTEKQKKYMDVPKSRNHIHVNLLNSELTIFA